MADMETRLVLVVPTEDGQQQLALVAGQLGGPAAVALQKENPAEYRRREVATRCLLALDFVVSGC